MEAVRDGNDVAQKPVNMKCNRNVTLEAYVYNLMLLKILEWPDGSSCSLLS